MTAEQERLSLDGLWTLYYCPDEVWQARMEDGGEPVTAIRLAAAGIPSIEAEVPGSVETALERAGLIGDPYYGENLLQLRPLEYLHVCYVRRFAWPDCVNGRERLQFDGVDTVADIWLNGVFVGGTDNMFIPHGFAAARLRQGENELTVHIRPAVLEARRYGYTTLNQALKYNYDALHLRKSAALFGWDILPRLVSAGIWRPVSLNVQRPVRVEQAYLYTIEANTDEARLGFFYELELQREPVFPYTVSLTAVCGGQTFTHTAKVWGKCGKEVFRVADPQLWWPRGYGAQALYDVTVELRCGRDVVDAWRFQTGIRTVRLERDSVMATDGTGRFDFIVNGRRVFLLGTNWVPPDALPARGDSRAMAVLDLVEDSGCNAIRIWGGGRYEREEVYAACDRRGILVWQDFMMACGNYPQTAEFAERLCREARTVVRALRHHPSLLVWAGDNECDMNYGDQLHCADPNANRLTRQVLPQLLLDEDFTRPYLPSSPYIDEECHRCGHDRGTEAHLWGERLYYKAPFYRDARAAFVSEIGYHGCPSPASLRRFLSPEHLWPPANDRQWLLHASSPEPTDGEPFAYRVELMGKQIAALFGEVPETLPLYCLASQISQAEAMKFFIESFRIRRGEKGGIIWWNIADGWPQFSDAVVDYYGTKKLAYPYIQRSQQPVCLMLGEAADGAHALFAVNDTSQAVRVAYTLTSMRDQSRLLTGCSAVPPDSAIVIDSLPLQGQDLVRIDWTCAHGQGFNTYLCGEPPYVLGAYLAWATAAGVLTLEGFEPADRQVLSGCTAAAGRR